MIVDVCEVVKAAIEAEGYRNVYVKRLDELTGKEGIVVRPSALLTARRYSNRTWTTDYIVNVMCRYRSEHEAMQTCFGLRDLLDGAALARINGSYRWTSTEVYTEPQEIALDEADMYVWSVQLTVRIERG